MYIDSNGDWVVIGLPKQKEKEINLFFEQMRDDRLNSLLKNEPN
jgi:hypothetical protein